MKFPIGYVGVGLMGGPMVKRLTALGWKVRGYDIVPERSMVASAAEAARLAADFPETLIVLNHTGLPFVEQLGGWRTAVAALAARPNVAVKISGLGNVAHKREVVLDTIELFGTGRAMFASNFPVDGLRATFDQVYSMFDQLTISFAESERRALFHDNAVRIYRMERQ